MNELHVYDGVILYLVTFGRFQRTLNAVLPPLHFAYKQYIYTIIFLATNVGYTYVYEKLSTIQ